MKNQLLEHKDASEESAILKLDFELIKETQLNPILRRAFDRLNTDKPVCLDYSRMYHRHSRS